MKNKNRICELLDELSIELEMPVEEIIDSLTGVCFNEEEASYLKEEIKNG